MKDEISCAEPQFREHYSLRVASGKPTTNKLADLQTCHLLLANLQWHSCILELTHVCRIIRWVGLASRFCTCCRRWQRLIGGIGIRCFIWGETAVPTPPLLPTSSAATCTHPAITAWNGGRWARNCCHTAWMCCTAPTSSPRRWAQNGVSSLCMI